MAAIGGSDERKMINNGHKMTGPVTWLRPPFIYLFGFYLFICSIGAADSSEPTDFYRTSFYVKLGRLHYAICYERSDKVRMMLVVFF